MSNPIDERGRSLEDEYFRRQEKELIEKMRAKMAARNAAAAALKCPKCEGTLVEVEFEGVQIDLCDACGGAWFDRGEFRTLVKKEPGSWLERLWGGSTND